MTIRILTDSTCDLPPETIDRYGIRVVPLYINVGRQGYLDGIDFTREEFYQKLPTFPEHPTTAVPSPQKFRAMYDGLAEEGADEVLSIHISSALSAIIDVARVAANDTRSTMVKVIDSRQLSLGTGFLVETAAKMAQAGCRMAEILPVLNDQIHRTYVFAALDTLEFLKRSGRMNGIVAGLGSLLQLKPIMRMYDGQPSAKRVRTRIHATERVIDMLRELGKLERVAIVHSNAHERVAELREKAAGLLPAGDLLTMDITPVLGAHLGPNAVGFAAVKQ
jgi:DegV family protein with EDD domain